MDGQCGSWIRVQRTYGFCRRKNDPEDSRFTVTENMPPFVATVFVTCCQLGVGGRFDVFSSTKPTKEVGQLNASVVGEGETDSLGLGKDRISRATGSPLGPKFWASILIC